MRLKKAVVQGCLQIGVVEADGQIGLLCLLSLKQLLQNAPGIIRFNEFNFVSCLVLKRPHHLFGKRSDVVGEDAKDTIRCSPCVEDDACSVFINGYGF